MLLERPTEMPGTIPTRVRERCGKGCYSHSQPSVQNLLRCSVQPGHCATSCMDICAHGKNTNTGSPVIVWTHKNTAHNDSNGYSAALVAVLKKY